MIKEINPFTSLMDWLNMILVVCSWRILRETRNRQFFDPLGRNVNWVQYLAMVINLPTGLLRNPPSILGMSKK